MRATPSGAPRARNDLSAPPAARPKICLGPVCVPLTALIPFLIGLAHKRGWLKWVNPNWFSWRWVRLQYRRHGPRPGVVDPWHDMRTRLLRRAALRAASEQHAARPCTRRYGRKEAAAVGQEAAAAAPVGTLKARPAPRLQSD